MLELLFGGKRGKEKNPPVFLLVCAMHHTCALCLVLPLNIYYPDDTHYHEGIFLLQGAAWVAFSATVFGWTLDIKSRKGLDQMRFAVFLAWITIAWSRVLRYGYVWRALTLKFMSESDPFLFRLALTPVVCMTTFNIPVFLDATKKLVKFCRMAARDEEDEKEPAGELRRPVLVQ